MALGGKTTSLQYIHSRIKNKSSAKLYSVKTEEDRTLFFDFLPITIPSLNNYKVKLKLYTVPGQVKYASTRRAVLAATDGIVFVVDSQSNLIKENQESLKDLAENLKFYNFDINKIPIVLQYNKRDLKNILPLSECKKNYNVKNWPDFPTIAINGTGVLDAFFEIAKNVVVDLIKNKKLSAPPNFAEEFVLYLRDIFTDEEQAEKEKIKQKGKENNQEKGSELKIIFPASDNDTGDQLIHQAVQTNMELTELYNELEETKSKLEIKVNQLVSASKLAQAIVSELDLKKIFKLASDSLKLSTKAGVSILLENENGELTQSFIDSIKEDYLMEIGRETGNNLHYQVYNQNKIVVMYRTKNTELYKLLKKYHPLVKGCVSLPLKKSKKRIGLINLYLFEDIQIEESTLHFFNIMANFISIAIENAKLYSTVNNLNKQLKEKMDYIANINKELEQKVAERTRELELKNKQLEGLLSQLRMIDKLKDDFMGLMSHELKTPLTSIITYAETIADGYISDPEELKKFAKVIQKEGTYLSSIVERVLDTVNIENNRLELIIQPYPLKALVMEQMHRLEEQMKEKKIKAEINLKDTLVMVDNEQAGKVIFFVLENAIKYNPPGELINIYSSIENNKAKLYIADSGPGIKEEDIEIIFDRFKLIEKLEHHKRGLGLSLHLAKRLMTKMQGDIYVTNPGGKGAEFCIEFKKA
ncbi:hypothetical protein TTHT_0653 [Thermotomaculum hydrothermale]|uniref:histidine kinase n=2 Tax=Thermotomaculum hydrothermale TaxID=981385 RepID=A0A7R6PMD7_9BACT|nr:hypothetical protein TTHT_0653 [Thermotomaculum hydrothermale]